MCPDMHTGTRTSDPIFQPSNARTSNGITASSDVARARALGVRLPYEYSAAPEIHAEQPLITHTTVDTNTLHASTRDLYFKFKRQSSGCNYTNSIFRQLFYLFTWPNHLSTTPRVASPGPTNPVKLDKSHAQNSTHAPLEYAQRIRSVASSSNCLGCLHPLPPSPPSLFRHYR